MPDKITEDGLKALLDNEISSALGYVGKLAAQRQKAIYYYNGDAKLELAPPEVDGRSSVVSYDVAEVVEWTMPQLCRIFAGSDEAVSFAATNEQGEAAAEQATAYCNHVFYRQNPGFRILHNWFKDALIEKVGILKVWWDDRKDVSREEYEGLTIPEIVRLVQDSGVQIVEASPSKDAPAPQDAPQNPDQQPQNQPPAAAPPGQAPMQSAPSQPAMPPGQFPQMPMGAQSQPFQPPMVLSGPRFDITIRRTKDSSKVCIENVPPEEFLLSRRARSMDEPFFCAHRVRTNPSKLKAEGYSNKQIESCTTDSTWESNNAEAIERRQYDDSAPVDANSAVSDPSLRDIWLHECYLNVDFDGDGIAELRKVVKCGSEILENEAVDEHPFALLTPILMPHRAIGRSLADFVFDVQRVKTVLWRQYLDSGYLANNPRYYVDTTKGVNLDDLLTVRPGGIVRGSGPEGVMPLTVPNVGAQALEGIQAMDDVRESRTGISKNRNITNPESINKTATEVNAATDASNQRIELIARVFAETGVADLFRLIQKLGSQYAQQALMLRINGEWQPVDPREWKTQFDMRINVGLGTGNKDQIISHLMALGAQQKEGMQVGITTPKNLYNTAVELTKALGLRDVDRFWAEPPDGPPPPQKPVEVQVAEVRAQTDAQVKQSEAAAKAQMEQARANADMQVEQHKATVNAQLEQQKAQAQIAIENARHQGEVAAQLKKAVMDNIVKLEAARIAAGYGSGAGIVEALLAQVAMQGAADPRVGLQ